MAFRKDSIPPGSSGIPNLFGYPPLGDQQSIKPGQEWFWTERWQAVEREVEADLAAGRFETFDTMEEFLESLE